MTIHDTERKPGRRAALAAKLGSNLGLRMALMLANPKAYETNLAELSESLAEDAIASLKPYLLPQFFEAIEAEKANQRRC
jgi:hypothetical protein